jgi:hypothetical protein
MSLECINRLFMRFLRVYYIFRCGAEADEGVVRSPGGTAPHVDFFNALLHSDILSKLAQNTARSSCE